MIVTLRHQLLCLLVLCFSSGILLGNNEVVIVNNAEQIYPLFDYLYLTESNAETDYDSTIFAPRILADNFTKANAFKEDFQPNQYYWGRFQVKNELSDNLDLDNWVLDFSWKLTAIEVYYKRENKTFQYSKTGAFVPPAERTFVPKIRTNSAVLKLPPNEIVTIYFKAISSRLTDTPDFQLNLIEQSKHIEIIRRQERFDNRYLGFALMFFLYNVFFFYHLGNKSFRYYAAYIFGIVAFAGYRSGILADTLYPLFFTNNPQFIQFFKLAIYFSLYFYIAFIRHFLQLSKVMPGWDKWFKLLGNLALPMAMIEGIWMVLNNFSFLPSDYLNILYATVFVGFATTFAICLLVKKRDLKDKLIGIGTVLMSLGIFITAILRMQELEYSLLYFQAASIAEFSCFSLSLAIAQKQKAKEKLATDIALKISELAKENQKKETTLLVELNDSKTQFYDNMTHDLKNPIAVIKGLVSLDYWNEANRKVVLDSANILLGQIQEILDFSKLNKGKLVVNLQQAELVKPLQEWFTTLEPLASLKKLQFSLTTPEKEIYLKTDLNFLEKIIKNLLENALKYTPKNGEINLSIDTTVDKIVFTIKDSGIGITENQQEKIFDRFYQIETEEKSGGTGIGLAIVKEYTKLLNGKIEVKSELGNGTTFILTIPKGIGKEEKEVFFNEKISSMNGRRTNIFKPVLIQNFNEEKEIAKEKLLIIDDNFHLVHFYRQLLLKRFHIIHAPNGKIGIEKAKELIPAVIICDVKMPELNGHEVCELLKSDETTNHIPIIMVTAKSSSRDRIKGFRNQVDAFVTKPFKNEELLAHFDRLDFRKKRLSDSFKKMELASKNLMEGQENNFDVEEVFRQKLIKVLEKNYGNENFAVNDLAAALEMKINPLRGKMRSICECTLVEFIRNFRLEKAKILLANIDLNIGEVALETGFKNLAVFSRDFKNYFGLTPRDFRKSL